MTRGQRVYCHEYYALAPASEQASVGWLELGLAHGKVNHHLLGAATDRGNAYVAIDALDARADTLAQAAVAAKDLRRLHGAVLHVLGGVDLEQGQLATERAGVDVMLHLVGQLLEPRLRALDAACHLGNLVANHLVVDQALTKGRSVSCILHKRVSPQRAVLESESVSDCMWVGGRVHFTHGDRFLDTGASTADGHDNAGESLVVKVQHNGQESLTLLADDVARRDADLVEDDVGSVGGGPALRLRARGIAGIGRSERRGSERRHSTAYLELARRDARAGSLDKEESDALHARAAGACGHSKVVGLHARRDELLFTADLHSRGDTSHKTSHIAHCTLHSKRVSEAMAGMRERERESERASTHQEVITIALGRGADVGDVAAGVRLGNRQSNDLLAADQRRHDLHAPDERTRGRSAHSPASGTTVAPRQRERTVAFMWSEPSARIGGSAMLSVRKHAATQPPPPRAISSQYTRSWKASKRVPGPSGGVPPYSSGQQAP